MASEHAEDARSSLADPSDMKTQALEGSCGLKSTYASPTRSASSSVRTVSTATYERGEQEAEKLFTQRIEKLCGVLWPPKSIMQRLSTSQAATRLRTNKFLRSLLPFPQIPLIERLRGGDLNHITGITLPSSYGEGDRNLILRVPRWDQNRLDREVAILNYVRQKTWIPVATIAATDFSCNNPLVKPYVLQHRIPGSDLDTVWGNLSHLQRCTGAFLNHAYVSTSNSSMMLTL